MGSGSKNCTDNMQKDITRIRFFIFIKEEESLFRFKVHSLQSLRHLLDLCYKNKISADDMHLEAKISKM